MRVYVGGRNDENIEKDKCLLKYNYGSRRHYSINTAILEKRLMYDTSIKNGLTTMCNISDLKASYNRQLSNIGCIVQEAVWVSKNVAYQY